MAPSASSRSTRWWPPSLPPARPRRGGGRAPGEANSRPGFTCALTTAGKAYCWGNNESSQLGDGTITARSQPVGVAGDLTFTAIDAGVTHACALTAAGAVYCWGSGFGQGRVTTPGLIGGDVTFRQISAGWGTTCGVTTDDAGYCFGDSQLGKLGDGGAANSPQTPVAISGGLAWRVVEVGEWTVCGLTTGGSTRCWAIEGAANAPGSVSTVPVSAVAPAFSRMVTGGGQNIFAGSDMVWQRGTTCGLAAESHVYCMGDNTFGQVGIGTTGFTIAEAMPVRFRP